MTNKTDANKAVEWFEKISNIDASCEVEPDEADWPIHFQALRDAYLEQKKTIQIHEEGFKKLEEQIKASYGG